MFDEEIFIAPSGEAHVIIAGVCVAGLAEMRVKHLSVFVFPSALRRYSWRQIAAAAEPGFTRHDVTRVEMDRRYTW